MIDFRNVCIGYGAQQVLDSASFHVSEGDRIGITGPNGAGKSTIFALISGECSPDKGDIELPKNLTLGYLQQHVHPLNTKDTLLDYVEHAIPEVKDLHHRITEIESQITDAEGSAREQLLSTLGRLQTDFEHLGAYELSTRAKTALGGLGFSTEDFDSPFTSFSGGWKMRAELAKAITARPDLLLLDEPTNFLDIPAVEWLKKFLEDYRGTMMLVSHDRYLLRTLTNVTLEVSGASVTRYAGNYDYYIEQRQQRHDQLHAAKANQDRVRATTERFIERFRSKNTKASQVQSRIKMLEKMETISVPTTAARAPRIRMPKAPHSGQEVMRLEEAGVTYDGDKWVLRGLDLQVQKGEKTALIGMNGMGKTTLLRCLAGTLKLNEGKRVAGHKVKLGYQSQDFAESMDPSRTVMETARSAGGGCSDNQVRSVLGSFFFSGDAVDKKVEVLSGGEKMRLAFARLFLNPPNFMILDEPTTHLDIGSREALERALKEYDGALLFVSHDIEFVRNIAGSIIAMTPPTIQRYPGGYDYYKDKTGGITGDTPAKQPKRKNVPDKKTLRRMRSEERQAAAARERPLKAEVARHEKEIERLETEQKELTEKLTAPDADYASLNRRLNELHYEIQIATELWEEATLALEEITG